MKWFFWRYHSHTMINVLSILISIILLSLNTNLRQLLIIICRDGTQYNCCCYFYWPYSIFIELRFRKQKGKQSWEEVLCISSFGCLTKWGFVVCGCFRQLSYVLVTRSHFNTAAKSIIHERREKGLAAYSPTSHISDIISWASDWLSSINLEVSLTICTNTFSKYLLTW